jgi:hypothetical protein
MTQQGEVTFEEGMLDDIEKELAAMELAEGQRPGDDGDGVETASAKERQAEAGVRSLLFV